MKVIHNLCGIFLLLFLLLFSTTCLYVAILSDSCIAKTACSLWNDPVFVFRMGVAVLTLTIVYLLSFPWHSKKKNYLDFETESGSVQVNLAAASNYLSKLKKEFAAVVSLTPKLRMTRKGVEVTMKTGIKSGTRIPELSNMLQQRSRECLSKDLGLENVSGIRIVIREISGTPQAAASNDHPLIDLGEEKGPQEQGEEESEASRQ